MTTLNDADNRIIRFNGLWSNWEELDLTMAGNTPLPAPTPKISTVEIEGSDGVTDTSWSSGYIRFNSIVIPYVFTHAISRYEPVEDDGPFHQVTNKLGRRRSLNEMNRLMKQHVSRIENWIFTQKHYAPGTGSMPTIPKEVSQGRLYDTGICNPEEGTGYYLFNARCTNFSVGKVVSSDTWVIQYSIEITADPYMYEYDANPETYTMFSGPSSDAFGMGETTVRIFTLSDSTEAPTRYLWTNDNHILLNSSETNEQNTDVLEVVFNFNPSTVPIYYGKIGVYICKYMSCTSNNKTYNYSIEDIEVISGNCTFVESQKILTPNEFVYTDQGGFSIRCKLMTNYDASADTGTISQLNSETSGKIPINVVWGTIKIFNIPLDTAFAMSGKVAGTNSFIQITGTTPGTVHAVTRTFGEPFKLDDDPYNELRIQTHNYGFYKLISPDNYRRTI